MRHTVPAPLFLRSLSTDEYSPQPYSQADLRVLHHTRASLDLAGKRLTRSPRALVETRLGTAAGLRALNEEYKAEFYQVPEAATVDEDVAAEVFSGRQPVIDVQTHFMGPRAHRFIPHEFLYGMYHSLMPDWWTEMDDLVQWDLAAYINNVFLETETAVAVLTSGPGATEDSARNLFNDEMAATRALFERFGGSGRILNHAVVHADIDAEVDAMEFWRDEYRPVGWKIYTPGRLDAATGWVFGWMLDDEQHGFRFLERARDLGVNLICAHKGISQMVDNGSPRDIGPAAKAFPDLQFVIYHSGYEVPTDGAPPEGPYEEATIDLGVNRLIASLEGAGVPKGSNVYGELGSTWFSLIRRPVEAAHVLGKLLQHLGEDNVIWGTDSIWYGAAQPLLDALRVFQIPDEMCERYGYPKITPEIKDKITSFNAARVYGIDLEEVRRITANDDLAWAKALLEDFKANGFSALR